MPKQLGPSLRFSEEIHSTKYRGEGESFRESMHRIAYALQDNAEHYHRIREILLDMRFLPAGRVQAGAGSTRSVTAYNCFVSGTIGDSYTDTDGIMDRATEAAKTMRMGGGIGYDFSTLRPRGELIRTLQSRTSGPISFMGIFNEIGLSTSSAGHRRGAQMGVLRVDHPDIEEFIHVKQNTEKLRGFNISIGVTDAFMIAVANGLPFDLVWEGKIYKTVDARTLWEMVMRSTWDWAEPGVLFIDRINQMNNLYYCETIAATNPCGEQPLPPYGACLLGSWNLVRYIRKSGNRFVFDYDKLRWDIPPIIRMMDNVVDVSSYPLEKQKAEAIMKRRMGIGITGYANAAEALGHPYGSEGALSFLDKILSTIKQYAYEASSVLAMEKGSFPLFDRDKYLAGQFVSQLPDQTLDMIYKYGIRNSHLLSIAPTGTISLAADNVSSGLEPVFALYYDRQYNDFHGMRTERVMDYGLRVFGVKGKVASECSVDDHINTLLVASQNVDSAVSKTCNVSPKMDWSDFKNIYLRAWKGGAKGCTTFNPGGQRMGILVETKEEPVVEVLEMSDNDRARAAAEYTTDGPSCTLNQMTGKIECE